MTSAPVAIVAPSEMALSKKSSTFRYCASFASGPISVSALVGSPISIDSARATTLTDEVVVHASLDE